MTSKSWHLDRRTFLRGAGVALALPFMNAMQASTSLLNAGGHTVCGNPAVGGATKRVCFSFFPNGVALPGEKDTQHADWHWFPKGGGKDFEFRTSQAALNPLRSDVSVISGLSNPAARNVSSHMGTTGYLTTKGVAKGNSSNSISIDQAIANHIGHQTQLPSLNLSSIGGVGSLNRTYTLSFDKDGKAIPSMSNLKRIYKRMYMAGSPEAKTKLARKEHLLDQVLADANNLRRNLGSEDQRTLDEYLSSVSDLEKRVENDKYWANRLANVDAPDIDLNIDYTDVENYIRAMYDMIYLCYKSDITRVSVYQIASEGGDSPVGQMSKIIGLKKDLHGLSHGAANRTNGYQDWGMWDQFVAKQFAYFLQRLKDTPEGDGSMLDNTLILHGSATGRSHDPHNYPLILAGGHNMGHQAGQFITYDEQQHALSNLFVRMGQSMDVPMTQFGDSTGARMSELFR